MILEIQRIRKRREKSTTAQDAFLVTLDTAKYDQYTL